MKKSAIILLTIISVNLTFAQDKIKETKIFIGFSYGKSFPLGDFKSNDVKLTNSYYYFNNNSGFANSGNKFDLFGGYALNNEYGVTGLIRFQTFSTDANSFANELERINPSNNYYVDSNKWMFGSVLGGMYYNYPLTKKLTLQPKGMVGLIFGTSPEINISANDSNNTRVIFVESGNSLGLGFEFGLGLKSKISDNFALMPTFDFSGGFLSFKNNKTVTNNNGTYSTTTRTYNPSILTFNFGLSLAYIL